MFVLPKQELGIAPELGLSTGQEPLMAVPVRLSGHLPLLS